MRYDINTSIKKIGFFYHFILSNISLIYSIYGFLLILIIICEMKTINKLQINLC